MRLLLQLKTDLQQAMRSGKTAARDALRMAIAALENRRIESGEALSEGEELAVLGKEVKKREDAAQQYEAAGRAELAERERAEIAVLQGYLPRQLSEAETRELVRRTIESIGATSKTDLGRVMKTILAEHRGEVDGKLVQRLAAELLG